MIVTHDSNLTGLSIAHLSLILKLFKKRNGHFVETVDLDDYGAPPVLCNLYGPVMDDPPITDANTKSVTHPRVISVGERLALGLPIIRRSNLLTVVTDGDGVLRETYGGPIRPWVPEALTTPDLYYPSRRFWQQHALGVGLDVGGV